MKKILSLIIAFSLMNGLLASPNGQEQIREKIKVVSVEIPVRVFYKEKPVDNLTKADFKLYEGKKKQTITSVKILKNKIKDQPTTPSRYFVLAFRVSRYNKQFRDGVRYIFDNVLVEQDQLLVFANNKSVFFNNLLNKEESLEKVNNLVREQSQLARGQMTTYLHRIEQEIDKTRFKMRLQTERDVFAYIFDFLERYLRVWKDYKRKYLVPKIDRFYYFSKSLENVKKEKWVISFYQMEMFPNISITGDIRRTIKAYIDEWQASSSGTYVNYARMLRTRLMEIDKEHNIADDFPAEEVSKIFYKVGATFHSIFMRSTMGLVSKDLEYRKISTDIENSLREITKATGGTLIATNDVESAANSIREKENICYLLTYTPENPDKIDRIKVQVNKKKHKVLYDDNMKADYIGEFLAKKAEQNKIPAIKIDNLAFKDKKLSVAINGFLLQKTEKGPLGRIGVHICIKNSSGVKVFDKGKSLTTGKDRFTISIPFTALRKGKYDIIVDVKDFTTGKTDQKLVQPSIM